ncbi:uncharacterized protein T551_01489 [Pneumocystis jirovecii RU7]|uniref:Uncharacterized protein n=1 Tax=Pneumocystis jirovecii (strain RU7) TaxID=1408657 RepID=A0A0W4ZRD7_PNEJ7|nr:uncharacterized protein T551_01489 [Pneumocystis jirovecii RU7]KTW30937.1 hypothetical protein T551_01489 [Pneumocystis jirovecii RU7]
MNFFYKNNETDALKDLLGPKSLYVYAKRKKVIKKTYSEILDIIEHMKLLKQELPDTTFSLDNKLLIMKAGDFIPSLVSADELFLIARIMLKAPVSELILEKKKDFCKFLIQIASLKGSDLAMLYIAEKKMKSGSSSELHEALYIYRNLSIKGNTKALLVLGNLSLKLNNNKQAERFYLKSIEGGNSDAMVSLAVLKKRMGEDKEAKYWFIHNPNGHFGRSLYTSDEESLNYLLQAASNGVLEAAHNLGTIYRKKGDILFSKEWYEIAAFSGFQISQMNLARLYEEEKSFDKSLFWVREAQKQGGNIANEAKEFENELLKKYPYLKKNKTLINLLYCVMLQNLLKNFLICYTINAI